MQDETLQTIAAVGTSRGTAAISILRLSGPDAFAILNKIFRPASAALPSPRTMSAGEIIDPDTAAALDSVMAVRFPAPASYTGEDLAEIHTHGGLFVTNAVFELLLREGARAALPGEFTLRAFANGKLDLTQAEAVNDIINARNPHFLGAAVGALQGKLRDTVRQIRSRLIDLLAAMEVVIEYPDEDVPELPREEISAVVAAAAADIRKLIENYAPAHTLNRGPEIALIGKPNVGKSSLMNRLLGADRSIIHETPGTTRDLVGDRLTINGVDALIMDTAGITTSTSDPVELEGVRRSKEFVLSADEVFFIIDASKPLTGQDLEIANFLKSNNKPFTALLNKIDLPRQVNRQKVEEKFSSILECIEISARTGEGIESAISHINNITAKYVEGITGVLITNARHKQLLDHVLASLQDALNGAEMPQDIITIDIRDAATSLGLITGEDTSKDILDTIFSNFCVGK